VGRPPWLSRGADRALVASVVAGVVGGALGTALGSDRAAEVAPWIRAWMTDRSGARSALAAMLGFQITLITVALSVTTLVYQSVVSQYSPRLFGLFSPVAPLYREIPLFVLSCAYTVAGVRELGLSVAGVAPRPVVIGALILLVVTLASVLATVARTFHRIQVEEVLHRTREETLAAARRLARARRALAAAPPLPVPPEPTPILAPTSGYVIGLDLARMDGLARRFALRARIDRPIGAFVARGEVLGWIAAPEGAPRDGAAERLAKAVLVGRRRSSSLDVGLGLRVLADVANRALSPSVNDPTTARQSLQQMRVILRALVEMPLGDVAIVDDQGAARVSIALPRFRDYLATSLEGPSRYGAGDADVVAEILDLALEVERAASRPERRAEVREMAARAVDVAAHRGEIDPPRLEALREKRRAIFDRREWR
jgi:uncharacterized membrane protein